MNVDSSAELREIGKYRLIAKLGSGGMANVFLACATGPSGFQKLVVLKVLKDELHANPEFLEMFRQEARLAARLNHPNIVQTNEIGEEGNLCFMAMEYLEGQPLQVIMRLAPKRVGAPLPILLRILSDVLAGLRAAHTAKGFDGRPLNIVHRDVSPHNVFVTYDGQVKLVDFGIAKAAQHTSVTQSGVIKGKVHFMAPEHARGEELDARADVFAVGVMLYETLTGGRMWEGLADHVILGRLLNNDAPRSPRAHKPDVPEALDRICQRALAPRVKDRYPNAREMQDDLDRFAQESGQVVSSENVGVFVAKMFAAERAAMDGQIQKQLDGLNRASSTHLRLASLPELNPTSTGSGPSRSAAKAVSATLEQRARAPRRRALVVAGILASGALLVGSGIFALSRAKTHGAATASEPSASVAPGAATQAPAVRGVSDSEILLGMSSAFSGPSKELGRGMKIGVETCFAEANEKGGVLGRRLTLVTRDDGYEPDRALPAMKELLEQQQVFGFIGNVGTPTAMVTAPYAVSQKAIFYAPFTGASILRHDPPDRYVINFRASYVEETAKAVAYMVDTLKFPPNSIVAFTQNDSFGDAGFEGISKGLRKYGVEKESILHARYARNTSDVEGAIAQVLDYHRAAKGKHPVKGVIMVGTYRPLAKFVRLAKDAGLDSVFDSVSFVGANALAEEFSQLGATYGKGVIVTQVVPHPESNGSAAIAFRESLAKHFADEKPSFVAFEGYLAAKVLLEALKLAARDLTTEKLIDAFESIKNLDIGTGGPISFGPSEHQGSHKVWGTILDEQLVYQVLDMD